MTREQKKVIIISGGTVVHIRPHLAISAPAYGSIGTAIYDELTSHAVFHDNEIIIEDIKTKMADSSSPIETNDDLARYIDTLLHQTEVKSIILPAAVCDFVPISVNDDPNIGKEFKRLNSATPFIELGITPATKIATRIKEKRPDIYLVTFKTTSGESEDALLKKAIRNQKETRANIVFGNDIKTKFNTLVLDDGTDFRDVSSNREDLIHDLSLMVLAAI